MNYSGSEYKELRLDFHMFSHINVIFVLVACGIIHQMKSIIIYLYMDLNFHSLLNIIGLNC